MSLMKNCKVCLKEKSINEFSEQKSRGKIYINNICIKCSQQKQKEYRENNNSAKKKKDKEYYEKVKLTTKFIVVSKEYRDNNKLHKQEYDKKYREDHKEEYKNYCLKNKEDIIKSRNQYYVFHKIEKKNSNRLWYLNNKKRKHKLNGKYLIKRLNIDMPFKLRHNISRTINKYLKLSNSSKGGNSILDFLPYTISELKEHLEKQFEPWMTWNNWGSYTKEIWNDNDSSTWKWQIDHIIPQSDLLYSSMKGDNFKKCWSLDNLRPYSAKQNLLDGIAKIRHGDK